MFWVLNGEPWFFDNAMLVVNTISRGEDPIKVPLFELNFWIQLHGLPPGFMYETVGKILDLYWKAYPKHIFADSIPNLFHFWKPQDPNNILPAPNF